MSHKPIIAIDIDDVLAANAAGFLAYSNEKYGTNLKITDYTEHWGELWRVDEAEFQRRRHGFNNSGAIAGYDHNADAVTVLQTLKQRYSLVCATSRVQEMQTDTRAWIDLYFPDIFDAIHHAGIYDGVVTDANFHHTKADLLQRIKADYLIDDQPKHCLAAAEIGLTVILFGDYPWNQLAQLPAGIVRCHDWAAIGAYFERQA